MPQDWCPGGIKKINLLRLKFPAPKMPFSLVRYQSRGILIPQSVQMRSFLLTDETLGGSTPIFFRPRKKEARLLLARKICTGILPDLVPSPRIMLQSHGTKNVKPSWKILLAPSHPPRLSFLIPSDGFLMNLASHIGSFINSMLRIFNLMITVRYSVTAWNLLRYKGPRPQLLLSSF